MATRTRVRAVARESERKGGPELRCAEVERAAAGRSLRGHSTASQVTGAPHAGDHFTPRDTARARELGSLLTLLAVLLLALTGFWQWVGESIAEVLR